MPDDATPQPPAPWTLRGEGWILPFRVPSPLLRELAHVPDHRREELAGGAGLVMLVEYHESPVGPYRELLTMPGTLPFADGRRHPTIDAILVDSEASVDGGRANWGIPKQLAAFTWERGGGVEHVEVTLAGATVATCTVRSVGPHLPTLLSSLPGFARTVAQERDGATYVTKLSGHGRVGAASSELWLDPGTFTDVTRGSALPALHASRFTLTFGAPRVLPRVTD